MVNGMSKVVVLVLPRRGVSIISYGDFIARYFRHGLRSICLITILINVACTVIMSSFG